MTRPREEIVEEQLIRTGHSLGFAVSGLQSALRHANAVEAIVLLQLIEDAAKLTARVNQLRGAM